MAHTAQLEKDVSRIKSGNAGNAPDGFARDLSLRKPEYWETRPYPNVIFHWTEAEFSTFLDEHRFPPNTLRDREVCRLLAIRSALVRGEFIPREVMADGCTTDAIVDAVMEVSANFSAAAKNREQQLGVLEFEKAIGYMHSTAEYALRLDALLAQAATAAARLRPVDRGIMSLVLSEMKEVGLDGLPFNLTISLRTPNDHNRYSGKNMWLEIRDARYNDVSCYGDVHRIEFSKAEVIFRRLLESGAVTLDQARSLLGAYWAPFTRVTVIRSMEAAA